MENNTATLYKIGEDTQIKVVGTKAAVWTKTASGYAVTTYVNVEMHNEYMREGTCIERKQFKSDNGACRFAERFLSAERRAA